MFCIFGKLDREVCLFCRICVYEVSGRTRSAYCYHPTHTHKQEVQGEDTFNDSASTELSETATRTLIVP